MSARLDTNRNFVAMRSTSAAPAASRSSISSLNGTSLSSQPSGQPRSGDLRLERGKKTASKCKTFLATATEECCPARGTLAGHFTRRLSPSPMPGRRIQQQRAYLPLKRSSPRPQFYRRTLACLRNRLENFSCRVKFIPIDCMTHPGISLEANNPTHIGERGCGLLDSLPRNVRVGIARAEKTRRAVQKAGVAERCAFRPDQPSRERDQSTITLRVPRHIFGCQACALGES